MLIGMSWTPIPSTSLVIGYLESSLNQTALDASTVMLWSNVHDRTTAALDPCPRFLRSHHSPCICLDRPPVCNLVSWTSPRVCHLRPNDFVDGVVSSYSRGDFLCDRLCEVSRLAHSKSGGSCPSLLPFLHFLFFWAVRCSCCHLSP